MPSAPPARPQAGDANSGSIVSPYQLTLGGVCGVCAGVFVKKGARALAFLLGGVFVLMQVSPCRGAAAKMMSILTDFGIFRSTCNPAHSSTSTGPRRRRRLITRLAPRRMEVLSSVRRSVASTSGWSTF